MFCCIVYENRIYNLDDGSIYDVDVKTQDYNYVFGVNDVLVSTTGSDATGDGSEGNPYASFEHALLQVPTIGGFTIWVEGGTYNPSTLTAGYAQIQTNFDNEVIVRAKPNETVILENDTAVYTVRFFNCSNITFEGFTCQMKSGNIEFFHSSSTVSTNNIEIRDCIINNVDSADTFDIFHSGGNSNFKIKRNTINAGSLNSGTVKIGRCENVNVIGNKYNTGYVLASAIYVRQESTGTVNVNNNTIVGTNTSAGAVYGIRMNDTTPSEAITFNVNRNNINSSSRGIGVDGSGTGRFLTLNMLGNIIDTNGKETGIRSSYGIIGGEIKYNTISTFNVCLGFPDEINNTPGREVGGLDIQYNDLTSLDHAMLFGENGLGNTFSNNICNASSGKYAFVIKGNGHSLSNNVGYGGTETCLLYKNCENCKSYSDLLIQSTALGTAIRYDLGNVFPPRDNSIVKAVVSVTNGEAIRDNSIGTGNYQDRNWFSVSGSGLWGNLLGSSLTSLQDLRDSWANNYPSSPNNDNKSKEII